MYLAKIASNLANLQLLAFMLNLIVQESYIQGTQDPRAIFARFFGRSFAAVDWNSDLFIFL